MLLNGMITDRTFQDVQRVRDLAQKGYSDMSAQEKSEWDAGMKGAYNASDLNRVSAAILTLVDALADQGYTVTGVNIPFITTSWDSFSLYTESYSRTYFKAVRGLSNVFHLFPLAPPLPYNVEQLCELSSWPFTYSDANNIEEILIAIDMAIENIQKTQCFSGELFCGEANA